MRKKQDGVLFAGISAVHPITKDTVPVYIADYVLGGYGTGVIFGSPAHDERDFAFAKQYGLPVMQVISGEGDLPLIKQMSDAVLINSGEYNDLSCAEAKKNADRCRRRTRSSGISAAGLGVFAAAVLGRADTACSL